MIRFIYKFDLRKEFKKCNGLRPKFLIIKACLSLKSQAKKVFERRERF